MGHGEGGGNSSCESVSESNEHKVWKSFAADALLNSFGDLVDEWVGYDDVQKRELVKERGLDAPKSAKNWRVGDVVLNFSERDEQLGEGIIVEVQHRNESKDIDLTTEDYIEQDYSVVWLYADDFSDGRCRLAEIDFRKRAFESAWPEFVPGREEWPESEFQRLKDTWSDAKSKGLVKYGASATLPPEWHDEVSEKIWREQSWYKIVQKNSTGLSEFTDSDVWHSEEYIEDIREYRPEVCIEINVPNEWYNEQSERIFREQDWDDLFRPSDLPKYQLHVALQGPAPSRNNSVSLPPIYKDDLIYHNSEWQDLFTPGYTHPRDVGSVEIEISFAQFFEREFWKETFLDGVRDANKKKASLQPPQTGFDDVQCHECGCYNYWKNAGEKCSCGVEYDWEWNVLTERISQDSVPEGIELAF